MNITIIDKREYKSVLWKNGKGKTTELIAAYHPSTDKFIWRVSIAGVVNEGEFSDFTGYDRHLLLLEGCGMTLDHGNNIFSFLKNRYDTAHFSGCLKTTASLVNGSIKDFNIMTHEEYCSADVDVLLLTPKQKIKITSENFLLFSPESNITINMKDSNFLTVNKGNLLHIYDSRDSMIEVTGGKIILIKIINK